MTSAYRIVKDFEESISEFTGSKYTVCVESCTAALFLCCKYCRISSFPEISIPKFTYPSVPCQIIHAGGRINFADVDWQKKGYYYLGPTYIADCAKIFKRGMYISKSFMCLSFHGKKALKIGRGGAILTDDKEAVEWFKCARFDGRHEKTLMEDTLSMVGWNMYMSPTQAARGLELMQFIGDGLIMPEDEYQDLSKYEMYTEANR